MEQTYILHRCDYVVSRGKKRGKQCYRPTIPRHGKNHWVDPKLMVCVDEDHRRWPDGTCLMCGDPQRTATVEPEHVTKQGVVTVTLTSRGREIVRGLDTDWLREIIQRALTGEEE